MKGQKSESLTRNHQVLNGVPNTGLRESEQGFYYIPEPAISSRVSGFRGTCMLHDVHGLQPTFSEGLYVPYVTLLIPKFKKDMASGVEPEASHVADTRPFVFQ